MSVVFEVAWLRTAISSFGAENSRVKLRLSRILCVESSPLCSAAIAQAMVHVPQPSPQFPVAVPGGAAFSPFCPAPPQSCCSRGACENRGSWAEGKPCGTAGWNLRMAWMEDDSAPWC